MWALLLEYLENYSLANIGCNQWYLQLISKFQESSIWLAGISRFSALHFRNFPVSSILGMKFKIEFVVLELCSTDTWSNRILINFSYYFQLLENPTQSNALRRFCLFVVLLIFMPFWLFLLVHFVSFNLVSNDVTQVSHDVFWSERVSPVFCLFVLFL